MAEITLSVPSEIEFRELATRTVAGVCKVAGSGRSISDEFTNELVSAVGEAFNNAVFHAYRDTSGPVGLIVRIRPDAVVVVVEDHGVCFDPDEVPAPNLSDPPESGMGIFIIRAFVDDLSYAAGTPNRLTLVKHF